MYCPVLAKLACALSVVSLLQDDDCVSVTDSVTDHSGGRVTARERVTRGPLDPFVGRYESARGPFPPPDQCLRTAVRAMSHGTGQVAERTERPAPGSRHPRVARAGHFDQADIMTRRPARIRVTHPAVLQGVPPPCDGSLAGDQSQFFPQSLVLGGSSPMSPSAVAWAPFGHSRKTPGAEQHRCRGRHAGVDAEPPVHVRGLSGSTSGVPTIPMDASIRSAQFRARKAVSR
jgi:hypothetical protein